MMRLQTFPMKSYSGLLAGQNLEYKLTLPQQVEPPASSAWDSSAQCEREQSECVAKTKKQRGKKKTRKSRGQGTSLVLDCSAPNRKQTAEDEY